MDLLSTQIASSEPDNSPRTVRASVYSCSVCGSAIASKWAKYCDDCRPKCGKPKLYNFTPAMDEAIRRAYQERAEKRSSPIPGLTQLAEKWNIPTHKIKKRAIDIGVARSKDRPWSDRELKMLHQLAWLKPGAISMRFYRAGFKRSSCAIKVKLRRIKARRENTDYYTAIGLSECFGVDVHTIVRWIRLAMLKAERQDPRIGEKSPWMIHEKHVREFIFRNPMEFDIRKVDQLWFMDLVTNGKIASMTGRPERRKD